MTSTEQNKADAFNSQVESARNSASIGELQGQQWSLPSTVESGTTTSAEKNASQFGTIIGTVLAIVSIAGTLLLIVNPRFDDINRNLDRVEDQLANLEARLSTIETNLTRLDSKLDAVGNMFIVAYQDEELAASEIDVIWRQASN